MKNKIGNYEVSWHNGILIDTGKKVRFCQYIDLPQMKVGEWFNCLDKKDLEQAYCLEEIKDGIYYFKKVRYDKRLLLSRLEE